MCVEDRASRPRSEGLASGETLKESRILAARRIRCYSLIGPSAPRARSRWIPSMTLRGPSLDQTIDFIRSLDEARTQGEICKRIIGLTRGFGVEHILAGTIPKPGSLSNAQKSNIILDYWPKDWIALYFKKNYLFSDPAIRKLADVKPFRWSELDPLTLRSPKAKRVMDEAGDFGLRAGITIPLLPIEHEMIGFSFAGRALEMSPHEETMLIMLASYSVARALVIRNEAAPKNPVFTAKEKNILHWTAAGFKRKEIAARMNVTEKAIDWHLQNIRKKLDVSTTAFAVAEAIRLRIIF